MSIKSTSNQHQVPFEIPENYFDELPEKVLMRAKKEKSRKKVRFATVSLVSSAAASLLLLWVFLFHPDDINKDDTQNVQIELSESEVLQYLYENEDVSETDLLEVISENPDVLHETDDLLDEVSDEAIEAELLDGDLELFYQ